MLAPWLAIFHLLLVAVLVVCKKDKKTASTSYPGQPKSEPTKKEEEKAKSKKNFSIKLNFDPPVESEKEPEKTDLGDKDEFNPLLDKRIQSRLGKTRRTELEMSTDLTQDSISTRKPLDGRNASTKTARLMVVETKGSDRSSMQPVPQATKPENTSTYL